jgi:hypothetical protein
VSSSAPYGYGPNKSYPVEKAPSVPVTGADAYVPTTMSADPANPFVGDGSTIIGPFMANYEPLQAPQSMGAQQTNSSRSSIGFPTVSSGASYFSAQQQGRDVSIPADPKNPSFVADHVISHGGMPDPFGTDMVMSMAGPQSLSRQGNMPAGTASGYGMMQTYISDPVREDGLQHAACQLDVVFPDQKRPAARRGPFQDPLHREQTAQTRRIGSCIRCRMQRVRVSLRIGRLVLGWPRGRPLGRGRTFTGRVTDV